MNALLPTELLLSPLILALFGLAIGSFLNVVIHRLPLMLERGWKIESAELLGVQIEAPAPIDLAQPRSRCPSCGHAIAWHENIPVLSYLRLRGSCAACGTRIAARYPLVEAGDRRCCSRRSPGASARSRPRCCGAASSPRWWRSR